MKYYEDGAMLKVLEKAMNQLPKLLKDKGKWESLLIDYDTPLVERLYTNLQNPYRLYLHAIHPCKKRKAFLHPHPWPSAIYITRGKYVMELGYSESLVAPKKTHEVVLSAGSYYEMIDPDQWHSVRPIDEESQSIMVSGRVWNRDMPKNPKKRLGPLSEVNKGCLFTDFERWLDGERAKGIIEWNLKI